MAGSLRTGARFQPLNQHVARWPGTPQGKAAQLTGCDKEQVEGERGVGKGPAPLIEQLGNRPLDPDRRPGFIEHVAAQSMAQSHRRNLDQMFAAHGLRAIERGKRARSPHQGKFPAQAVRPDCAAQLSHVFHDRIGHSQRG